MTGEGQQWHVEASDRRCSEGERQQVEASDRRLICRWKRAGGGELWQVEAMRLQVGRQWQAEVSDTRCVEEVDGRRSQAIADEGDSGARFNASTRFYSIARYDACARYDSMPLLTAMLPL